jgi:penicillin-binding protein 1B
MPNFTPRLPKRGTVFRIITFTVVGGLIAFVVLTAYVYKQSVGRFELRRLSLPTRIYADYTPLKAGVPMQADDLLGRLDRLGYREVKPLSQPGDYTTSRDGIEIYLREFTHPTGTYRAQQVKVTFKNNAIASVTSDNAALEPELLTSILGDQLENRRPVKLDQIPKSLQDAVIATEDVRFWHHPGVDPLGILRAVFRNITHHGVTEGGSTLTQQLVKNYYLTNERTYRRKITEAFMAVILDAKYSKREILEAYLNDIYLGRNRSISIIGVGEAARFYFGTPASEIDLAESALLAAMIRSPNNYSPFVRADIAMQRRSTVLKLMLDQRKIDQAQYQQAMAEPLPRRPFRDRSGLTSIPFYVDRVLQEMSRDYGIKDVKGRGLQIYTAIDLAAQDDATRTLEAGLQGLERGNRRLRRSDPQQKLQGVLIHVDVPTGEIRALVGGRNYDINQFNRALNSKRLVGSLFKPFVYLTAIEPSLSQQNITPATLVSDTRFVFKRRFAADWSPRNYDDKYYGTVTVQEALEHSLNSASVRIGLACGLQPVFKTAKTLGVTQDFEENPAVLLGAVGIPPVEMADAFSTMARMGSRVPLRTIRFVTNDRGTLLSAGDDIKPVQVFPARDMSVLVNMMKGVIDRGTAAIVRSMGFRRIAAGKTGTTNDKRDAWFIGFTPQTLALTWVGFDDDTPTGLAGGEAAAPIWARYMLAATPGEPNVDFATPPGIAFAAFDETSGGLAVPQCPKNVIVTDAFKDGTQPANLCPIHSPQLAPLTLDQFGIPIMLDTAQPTTTEGAVPPATTQPPPDSTLTGGVFRTETSAPPPQPPPPITTTPNPSTNTSPPPTSTTTSPPPLL